MIMRGGGVIGPAGLAGGTACICVTLFGAGTGATGGVLPLGGAGAVGTIRGGTAMAGGAAVALVVGATTVEPAAGVAAAGRVAGTLGGITTTEGGR